MGRSSQRKGAVNSQKEKEGQKMEILERIKAGTQYRSMMLDAHDDKRMIVEGYAATFNRRS